MKLPKFKINIGENTFRSIVDGTLLFDLIKKNALYIAFCVSLLIFYIGNRYKCEYQLTKIEKLENDITDLHYENITTSAELMSRSRQSEVTRAIKERGIDLEESIKAPQRIYIDK